jgi:L-fucose isomerase-like protein
MKNARLGAVGARPNGFNTVRFSEKLLQACGISVSTIDLSEVFGAAERLKDNASKVKTKLKEINAYVPTQGVSAEALVKMAKLGIVLDDWIAANDLNAIALQCWNSIQQNYGINACGLMSMMSERMLPSACEVDITGAASMPYNWLRATPAPLWTGTTIMRTIRTNVCFFTVATGPKVSSLRPECPMPMSWPQP